MDRIEPSLGQLLSKSLRLSRTVLCGISVHLIRTSLLLNADVANVMQVGFFFQSLPEWNGLRAQPTGARPCCDLSGLQNKGGLESDTCICREEAINPENDWACECGPLRRIVSPIIPIWRYLFIEVSWQLSN
jgi:hypothetical protein